MQNYLLKHLVVVDPLLKGFSLYLILFSIQCKRADEQASAPTTAPPPPQVQGFIVAPSALTKTVFATGNLLPNEEVELQAERAGRLVKLIFDEGRYVERGKLLAQVDDAELQAQKNKTLIELNLAKNELARGKELMDIQGISAEDMDRLSNEVKGLEADIALLDIQIEKSKILAPFGGLLGLRRVSPGAYLNVGSSIGMLQQISKIKIEFDVPERYLQEVSVGQSLTFRVDGMDEEFAARVYAIDRMVSPETRTFKLRAIATNAQHRLTPGQLAKISLITGRKSTAFLVPSDAVIPVLEGKVVFKVEKGVVTPVPVTTGERTAGQVEITRGLNEGDTILITGLLTIGEGDRVQVDIVDSTPNLQ